MKGYVYLIRMGDTDYYKIGVSTSDPQERLETLQIGNPYRLEVVAASKQFEMYRVEKDIHTALRPMAVRGEWFKGEYAHIFRVFSDYTAMALVDTMMNDASDDTTVNAAFYSVQSSAHDMRRAIAQPINPSELAAWDEAGL